MLPVKDRVKFFIPPKRNQRLSIAIPASLVSSVPHLREKTMIVGFVARAATIFRVEEILIYRDQPHRDQRSEIHFVSTLLSYMETPQYLRKRIFPITLVLKYAGILPPLRTPHHPLTRKICYLKDGDFREGVIVNSSKGKSSVDIGVERPIPLNETLPIGKRITITIGKTGQEIKIKRITRSAVNVYWGYDVNIPKQGLGELITMGLFDLTLLTSKYGRPFKEVINQIRARWKKASSILIAFGSPQEGLREILRREGMRIETIGEFIVNTIPWQGTATARTEEALYTTLAVLNAMV